MISRIYINTTAPSRESHADEQSVDTIWELRQKYALYTVQNWLIISENIILFSVPHKNHWQFPECILENNNR